MQTSGTDALSRRSRPLVGALLMASALGCGNSDMSPAWSAGEVVSAGYSKMPAGNQLVIRRTVSPSRCVDLAWNSESDATPLIFWDCHDGVNQKWLLRGDRLVSAADKCVEVQGRKAADGARLQTGTCTADGEGQKWVIEGKQVKLKGTTKCLDLDHGNTAPGMQLQIWECSKTPNINQAWDIKEVSSVTHATAPEDPSHAQSDSKSEILTCPGLDPWENQAIDFEAEVLSRINAARAKGADCHSQGKFAARGPLKLDNRLVCTARAFAKAMSEQQFFSHNSPDGRTPFDRMTHAGVHWRAASENIADGQQTPESVVSAWLASDHHCADLMGNYALTGVGFFDLYWVQDFATEF